MVDESGMPISPEFRNAVMSAIGKLKVSQDEAQRYMVEFVPVYALYGPSYDMKVAGGSIKNTYLGLWTDHWNGYPGSPHGLIFLFESGIRTVNPDVYDQTYQTLVHEMDHALQRDHVLAGMHAAKARGWGVQGRAQSYGCRPCLGIR